MSSASAEMQHRVYTAVKKYDDGIDKRVDAAKLLQRVIELESGIDEIAKGHDGFGVLTRDGMQAIAKRLMVRS